MLPTRDSECKVTAFYLYLNGLAIVFLTKTYITPSSRSFCCHFQAERITSSSDVSAFHPSTLLALEQSPQIFSMSPSRRGPYFQLSFTPVARSKVSTISSVELPDPCQC